MVEDLTLLGDHSEAEEEESCDELEIHRGDDDEPLDFVDLDATSACSGGDHDTEVRVEHSYNDGDLGAVSWIGIVLNSSNYICILVNYSSSSFPCTEGVED